MGASASIEVSFIDKTTGELLGPEKIASLSKEANYIVDSFDFSGEFYRHYNNPDNYLKLREQWEREQMKITRNN